MKCRHCDGTGKRRLIEGSEVDCSECEGMGALCGHSRPPEFCWECWKAQAEDQRAQHARALHERHDAEYKCDQARAALTKYAEALVEMVNLHCRPAKPFGEWTLYSHGISTNADAMRLLADAGILFWDGTGDNLAGKWTRDNLDEELLNAANIILAPEKYVKPAESEEPF